MPVRCGRLTTRNAVSLSCPLVVAVLLVTGSLALGQSAAAKEASEANGSNAPSPGAGGGNLTSPAKPASLRMAGTNTASRSLQALYEQFRKKHPELSVRFRYDSSSTSGGLEEFFAGRAEVAVIRRAVDRREQQQYAKAFPDPQSQPEEMLFSKAVLVIVVHKSNPVAALNYGQIEDIYRGKITNWSAVGGPDMAIARRGTRGWLLSYAMFFDDILRGKRIRFKSLPTRGGPRSVTWEQYRKMRAKLLKKYPGGLPFTTFRRDKAVLKDVAKTPGAIGYTILPATCRLPAGLRAIAIAAPGGAKPVSPTLENIHFDRYPLQRTIRFLVHPNASDICRKFVTFACSEEAAGIVREAGLIPASDGRKMLVRRRRTSPR